MARNAYLIFLHFPLVHYVDGNSTMVCARCSSNFHSNQEKRCSSKIHYIKAMLDRVQKALSIFTYLTTQQQLTLGMWDYSLIVDHALRLGQVRLRQWARPRILAWTDAASGNCRLFVVPAMPILFTRRVYLNLMEDSSIVGVLRHTHNAGGRRRDL